MPGALRHFTVFKFSNLNAFGLTIHDDAAMILTTGFVCTVASGDAFIAWNQNFISGTIQPCLANCNDVWIVGSDLNVEAGTINVIVKAADVQQVNHKGRRCGTRSSSGRRWARRRGRRNR